MKNPKVQVDFRDGIMHVIFENNAIIDADTLAEIYEYANRASGSIPYGILFEAKDHYDVTDDGIAYISSNPSNKNVIAKVYVVDHKEVEVKTRFHLLFDHPALKPFVFKTYEEGMEYLRDRIKTHAHS